MKLFFIGVLSLLLVACYEDTDVTFHEAGVYKGKQDRHDKSAEQREQLLKQRFLAVQTDR
jgi:major membrane immunogen (membrane-anchored lipoprotein)